MTITEHETTTTDNPKARPPWRRIAMVTLAAVLAGGAGAAGGAIGAAVADHTGGTVATDNGTDTTTGATAAKTVAAGNLSIADVVQALAPSVVTIDVETRSGTAEGSGVVIGAHGEILTNNHVVAGGRQIRVTFANGSTAAASVVRADATVDLAVVRVSGVSGLVPATLATGNVAVGDTVVAFGSPLGLSGTVTAGIVSALDRQLDIEGTTLSGLIQTDAAINAGNSGGPLVNLAGQVVGIDVAIATASQDSGNIGVGFAVPAATARSFVATVVR